MIIHNNYLQDVNLDHSVNPPDFSNNLISFLPPVILDLPGVGKEFGACVKQPANKVRRGDTVSARFVRYYSNEIIIKLPSFP